MVLQMASARSVISVKDELDGDVMILGVNDLRLENGQSSFTPA